MLDLDKWLKDVQNSRVTNRDEIEEYMMAHAITSEEPYRLEVLYKPEGQLVVIQGNDRGLKAFLEAVERLVHTSPIGGHIHYDAASGLSKSEIPLIIQKIGDDGDGVHTTQ